MKPIKGALFDCFFMRESFLARSSNNNNNNEEKKKETPYTPP
jgi:hypothetical protein